MAKSRPQSVLETIIKMQGIVRYYSHLLHILSIMTLGNGDDGLPLLALPFLKVVYVDTDV